MKKFAFTMAEILISLTIVGIVAAITIPALQGNVNEKTWMTQRKTLYTRMAQAISMMPSLNDYGVSDDDEKTISNSALAFVAEGLSKSLRINNICDNDHLIECGIPLTVTTMGGETISFPKKISELNPAFTDSTMNPIIDTKAAAFETLNGENVAIFYNPYCTSIEARVPYAGNPGYVHDEVFHTQNFMCANFVYDLNGAKGPNTFGKDIGFMTALYSTGSVVVAPVPVGKNTTDGLTIFENSRSLCTQREENSRVPNINELIAMTYNSKLLNMTAIDSTQSYWSSSLSGKTYVWIANIKYLIQGQYGKNSTLQVRCVKR
ncbi:prepilin-type N-terminal cleavage/methylation domain-containing protein [bacterium]|nr:prepilin-type N-terminal cleavage/methylation domain-containing protein [bacterium]